MAAASASCPALARLARETTPRYAPVDALLDGVPVAPGMHRLQGDAFILHTDSGYVFRYRPGEGLVIARPAEPDDAEEALWRNGSVYAAIAAINGLRPIHASAVAHGGRVYAFTGPSGAGKSTLVAALGTLGLPMFCDDTLVLDLSDPDRVMCLPGHKRLKLTDEAFALTGAERRERVGTDIAKHFATPPGGEIAEPLPLAELVFLEVGAQPEFLPIAGAQRFLRLSDDHYTQQLHAAARGHDLGSLFAEQARLARQVALHRFIRPRDPARFAASAAVAAAHVRNSKEPQR